MRNYNKSNIKIARILRKNMTEQERKLWYLFLREYPIRFQRQKSIDNFITDFYCAKAKLIIELDGSGHYEPIQILKDKIRTEHLEEMDLTVIRICNLDVDNNFQNVCEYIDTLVKGSLPHPTKSGAPSSEGAESDH